MNKKAEPVIVAAFLAVQTVLYVLILTAGGPVLRWSEFGAIVLCAAFALAHIKTGSKWLIFGLLCTLGADFCLVACQPQQQLWGMVFFLGTQTFYAVFLHCGKPSRALLWVRLGLVAAAELVTVLVLGSNTDALALISLAYYAMLIMNIIAAFTQWRSRGTFPVALVLFLLCDTVVGLQVAAGGYLPIGEDSWLHSLLFSGFNLAWFFYLPSQVLIALEAKRRISK